MRESSMPKRLPEKKELLDAMKVGETSIEAAEYLAVRVKQIFSEANLPGHVVKEIVDKVNEYAQLVSFKLMNGSGIWSGQMNESTDFRNMQKNIAEEAARNISGLINGRLRLDIAINGVAQLLRGYSVDGKPIDAQTVDQLDKLFNAWLAENGWISKGSTIYESSLDGEIKKDSQGKEVKADSEKVKNLLNDKEEGFARFLEKKGVDGLMIQQQAYPEAQTTHPEHEEPTPTGPR